MRILWLKTELLHPVDKGGRIRTYNMLRALRREHQVTYLTLDDGTAAPDAVERATEYCHDLVRVPFATAPKRSVRFFAELAANLVSPLPYAISKYRSEAMRHAIARAVSAGTDVVVCDFLSPSLNVPSDLGVPTVLFQHNVEAMIWKRHAQVGANPVRKAYMREQWRRMVRHERKECRRFDYVIAVSPEDTEVFTRDYGVRHVSDVATGVDTDYFRPSGHETPRVNNLVFTGSMDWMPNEDAILWFADEILPRIRAVVPDVTLTVVGRHPPPRVRALAAEAIGIEVTGSVPDVRPYMERAAAFVVPIRIGGGTRLKVYEAMAMERPVISTPIGAEGLPLRDGVDALLAAQPAAFADSVIEVLQNSARARSLAQEGAALVRARHGWDRVAEQFAATCEATRVRGAATANGRETVAA